MYFAFRCGLSIEIVGDPLHLLTGEARGALLTKLAMLKAAHSALDLSLEEQHDLRASGRRASDNVLSGGMERTQAASMAMLEALDEEVGRLHSDWRPGAPNESPNWAPNESINHN